MCRNSQSKELIDKCISSTINFEIKEMEQEPVKLQKIPINDDIPDEQAKG
jgi:hypothetical protein